MKGEHAHQHRVRVVGDGYGAHLCDCLTPVVQLPTPRPPILPLLQTLVVPQVVNLVQLSDLAEPSPGREVTRLLPRLQARTPLVLPLEERARAEGVGPQLVQSAELLGLGSLPECKLLAELVRAGLDQREDLVVEVLEVALNRERQLSGEWRWRSEDSRLTDDCLTSLLVVSKPGRPWYSQM